MTLLWVQRSPLIRSHSLWQEQLHAMIDWCREYSGLLQLGAPPKTHAHSRAPWDTPRSFCSDCIRTHLLPLPKPVSVTLPWVCFLRTLPNQLALCKSAQGFGWAKKTCLMQTFPLNTCQLLKIAPELIKQQSTVLLFSHHCQGGREQHQGSS